MKRGLVLGVSLSVILLAGLVSAQSALLDSMFAGLDAATVTLAILFVIFFAVLYFATSKVFKSKDQFGKDNKTIPAVLSLAISLLIVYWINQSASVGNLFSNFGLSDTTLYTIGGIALIALTIFLFVKLKVGGALLILGGICFIAALTNLVYNTTAFWIIGAILIVLGLIFMFKKKRNPGSVGPASSPAQEIHIHNHSNPADAQAHLDAIRADEARAKREIQEEGSRERARMSQDIASLSEAIKRAMKEYEGIRNEDPADTRLNSILQDINEMKSRLDKMEHSKMTPQQEESARKEVLALENKTAQDERAAATEERVEISREKSLVVQNEQSLSNSLKAAIQKYNEVARLDPSNSAELIRLRNYMQAIRNEQRKIAHAKAITPEQQSALQNEVRQIESQASSEEGRATQLERRDIQTATERNQQYQQDKQRMFEAYRKRYDDISREYNQLLNGSDTKDPIVQKNLQKLAADANEIRNELKKIEKS